VSSSAGRLWGAVIATLVACAITGIYIGAFLTNAPGYTAAAKTSPGNAQLYLGTVAAAELTDKHPTWVSYYTVDPNLTHWHHNTTFILPAHSLIHVTVYQFDGQSGLRNEFLSQASGIVGGAFGLSYDKQTPKPTQAIDPDAASHVFAIPQLGVSVPLEGIPDDAKNPCNNAPCSLSQDHYTISFTFRTGAPGVFRWQCFVPCAAGYIQGFGGPMQTVGYMDGFIKVV
jgi:hypothetical protein